MQERQNSIANALELCLSCTNPSICKKLFNANASSDTNLLNAVFIKIYANDLQVTKYFGVHSISIHSISYFYVNHVFKASETIPEAFSLLLCRL